MKFLRLGWAEIIGVGAGVALLVSLKLPWYVTDPTNRRSEVNGLRSSRGPIDAFDAYQGFEYVLIAACVAPLILALIVVLGVQVSWDRGEITAIIGVTTLVLILYKGLLGGTPDDAVDTSWGIGYYAALIASLGIFMGGAMRLGEGGPVNKPPGV